MSLIIYNGVHRCPFLLLNDKGNFFSKRRKNKQTTFYLLQHKAMKLTLHNDINEVPMLGEWIEQVGEELGLDMSDVFQINLALEEAVVNVMNYAYPGEEGRELWLEAEGDNKTILFTLSDEGGYFDPTKEEMPDVTLSAEEREIGGLGIFLVKQLMKSVNYERKNDKNILEMTWEKQ